MNSAAPGALVDSLDALAAGRSDAGALGAARAAALDAARRHGVPSTRQERWKYTALRALSARRFEAPAAATDVLADVAALIDVPSPRVVFANGRFSAALSSLDDLPAGLSLRLLSDLLRNAPEDAAAAFAETHSASDETFQQWNAAIADDGLVLDVAPGQSVNTPFHLVELGIADGSDRALHVRHRVTLGAGSGLTLVHHQRGIGAHRNFANSVFSVHLGDGARLVHARVQTDSDGATLIQRTQGSLQANATYRRLDLELGAALSRHELHVSLDGEGACLQAHGVLLADGRRHVDTRLGIEHRARDTRCELTWRGYGADRGRAVFHGGILIAEGADGSNAALSNKNLLLSDGAEIDTQPVLVIHADDIQAAHGATVGYLDDKALFYLRARGLPKADAVALLTAAFLREPLALLVDDSPEGAALEATLIALLDARLATADTSRVAAR
jgi:Fe-S cluster assembly protein SufD